VKQTPVQDLAIQKEWLKNIHPVMLASLCSLTKNIFKVITPKNTQNDRLYAHPSSIKKKDIATKCLCTQLTFSHWRHQLVSRKLLTLHTP